MKLCILAALALMISATASLAEQPGGARARGAAAAKAASDGRRADTAIGRDGQDVKERCSAENPNIEYRDCVNAATRDPNAKVRMG